MQARRALVGMVLALGLGGCGGGASTTEQLPPELLDFLGAQVQCPVDASLVLVRQHRWDFTGDAVPDALAAVRCDTGAGAPPSVVYAIAAGSEGPEVAGRLLSEDAGEVVKDLSAAGSDATVVTFGYGPQAPRCCPDLEITHRFRFDGERFVPAGTQAIPLPEVGTEGASGTWSGSP